MMIAPDSLVRKEGKERGKGGGSEGEVWGNDDDCS